ncbi:hypothetical protein CDD83_2958 [Cordyceps sp. RAO-2017]|nr:hypothetical protein CDD83_2958 [Cordyceps sp. RAO-2017]
MDDVKSPAAGPSFHPNSSLYRLNSNQSSSNVFEDVEMAHEEQYSGPVAESLPSSVSAFSHRRARAASTTSFTYYEEEPETMSMSHEQPTAFPWTGASDSYTRSSFVDLSDAEDFDYSVFDEEQADGDYHAPDDDDAARRNSFVHSQNVAQSRLLRRDSTTTAASSPPQADRASQKIYMANEDLTIAIAGFRTSPVGVVIYTVLCFISCDYRYVRFFFHPLMDKFLLSTGWKDPEWTDVRSVRSGLDSDEKAIRNVVFGSNIIDIQVKSSGQLLIDEALHPFYIFQVASLVLWSVDSYYYYAACIFVIG